MTLLETASELYAGILAAKPKTDPMFLEFQQFMTTHFGHPGTVAMREIEAQPIEYTYKQNPTGTGRKMRAFQHPLNAAKMETLPNVQTTPIIAPLKLVKGGKEKQTPISKSYVLTAKVIPTAQPAAEMPGKSDDHSSEKNQRVADDEMVETIDVELAKTMKAKAFGETYKPATMRAWLNTNGVELSGKESATQLAKIIIDTITTGAK